MELLKEALSRYQALNYLSKKDVNYQKPGVAKPTMTHAKEVELYLNIAECKRLMATQIPENDIEKKVELLKEAANDVHCGHLISKKLPVETDRDKKIGKRTPPQNHGHNAKRLARANLRP